MSDRIVLEGMVFQGTHGVYPEEQVTPQPFEVDVELGLNLQPAGLSDDLAQTVDYARVYETCRVIVESTRFNLVAGGGGGGGRARGGGGGGGGPRGPRGGVPRGAPPGLRVTPGGRVGRRRPVTGCRVESPASRRGASRSRRGARRG